MFSSLIILEDIFVYILCIYIPVSPRANKYKFTLNFYMSPISILHRSIKKRNSKSIIGYSVHYIHIQEEYLIRDTKLFFIHIRLGFIIYVSRCFFYSFYVKYFSFFQFPFLWKCEYIIFSLNFLWSYPPLFCCCLFFINLYFASPAGRHIISLRLI